MHTDIHCACTVHALSEISSLRLAVYIQTCTMYTAKACNAYRQAMHCACAVHGMSACTHLISENSFHSEKTV